MKAIESKSYANQNSGGGFVKGLLTAAVIGILVMAVSGKLGENDTVANSQTTPNIVINMPASSAANTEADSGTEDEVAVPINTQYSCRGNYYSIFTQQRNVTDNCGTTYDTANVAVVGSIGSAKKLTYNLDGSFTTLSGTIALAEKDKDRINYFRVYVYNEDGDCIYQSSDISDKSPDPIEVNCNISGLTRITIEMEGCSTTCTTVSVIMPDEGFVFKGPSSVVNANS